VKLVLQTRYLQRADNTMLKRCWQRSQSDFPRHKRARPTKSNDQLIINIKHMTNTVSCSPLFWRESRPLSGYNHQFRAWARRNVTACTAVSCLVWRGYVGNGIWRKSRNQSFRRDIGVKFDTSNIKNYCSWRT
jgi:hypothetical protein